MNHRSLISICIPTYNGAQFLKPALDSVVSQTYKNIEVVVSDDASQDETLKVVEEFKSKVDFPVYIYHHKPTGIGANWNNCIQHANGDFIKFLFQDDVLHPECIEKMVSLMEANKKIGLVCCKRNFKVEGEPNEEIRDWIKKYGDLQESLKLPKDPISFLDKKLFKHPEFLRSPLNKIGEPSCVLFRKSIIKKVGYFREDLKQILDYEFYYRILKHRYIAIINEELVCFRIHPKQATNVNRRKVINDYKNFDKILYQNFLLHLNIAEKKRLFLKYNLIGKTYKKLKNAAGKRR